MNTEKPACSNEPFTLDYSDFYTTHGLDPLVDLITSSTWAVTGATKGSEFIATPETSVFIDGGTVGVDLTAVNTIEINGGTYKTCATIYIEVF